VTNQPTKTWVNPRPGSTPEWLRPTLQSLEAFLARPHFYNGIRLGDGTAPSQDQEGTTTLPDTTRWDSDAVTTIEDALAGLGTDLTSVYATLATMEADIIALETDPIDGTRITDDSIDTPQLKANSVTATNLAALNIGVSKWIASTSYTAGVDGWIIAADGTAEFNDVTVRGTLDIADGEVYVDASGGVNLYRLGGVGTPEATAPSSIKWRDDVSGGGTVLGSVSVNEFGTMLLKTHSAGTATMGGGGDVEITAFHDVLVFGDSFSFVGKNVMTAAHMQCGRTTGTTDGSGHYTVTHGLGSTPTSVVVTMDDATAFGGLVVNPVVISRTSTQFTVGFYNSNSGAAFTATSMVFHWIAAANA
jgi:hypothetical protein